MSRTRLPAEERREQLLDAASRVLVRDGAEACTVEAIAAEAGVRRGLVHYHYGTRDDVLVALYTREQARFRDHVTAAAARAGDTFAAHLHGQVRGWLDASATQPVLDALANARTDGARLERARAAASLTVVAEWAAAIETEYGLTREAALATSGLLLASSPAVLPVRGVTGWSDERIADHVVTLWLAALDAAAAVPANRA